VLVTDGGGAAAVLPLARRSVLLVPLAGAVRRDLFSVFGDDIEGPPGVEPVPFPQYFAAGMIAAGIMSTSFTALAISIANEQHNGTLKRLGGTPLPKTAYFAGKVMLALITSALQTAIILGIGIAFYDMSLPSDPGLLALFAGVFVLGVASCSMLGIAYTWVIRNANSAAAVVQPHTWCCSSSLVFLSTATSHPS
jgi:ABC-2 type transport system permease protein